MPDNYARDEIMRLLDAGPYEGEDFFRLQVTGNGSTKWVNVTPSQLARIRDVLEADNPDSVKSGYEDMAERALHAGLTDAERAAAARLADDLPAGVVAAVDAAVDAHLADAKAEFEAALHKLLADWFEGALGRISEHGTSRDWPALIEDAKARHEALGVPWSDTFVPEYVREILALTNPENT